MIIPKQGRAARGFPLSPKTHLWPMMSGMGKISGASKNSLLSSSSSLRSPLAGQHKSGKGDGAGEEGTSFPVSC